MFLQVEMMTLYALYVEKSQGKEEFERQQKELLEKENIIKQNKMQLEHHQVRSINSNSSVLKRFPAERGKVQLQKTILILVAHCHKRALRHIIGCKNKAKGLQLC